MRVGIDFDGVCHDVGWLKAQGLKEEYGVEVEPAACRRDIIVDERGLLTDEEYSELQSIIYDEPEWAERMKPLPGAEEYCRALADNHYVTVITSRPPDSAALAEEWIRRELALDVPVTGVGFDTTKEAACRSEALDVYVDDDREKLVPLQDVVPHRFFFRHGYNEHEDPGSVAESVWNWEAFMSEVRRIDEEL